MQEASAKGKSDQFKDRSDAMAPDRPRTWPGGSAAEMAKAPTAVLVNGKGTKASAKRRRGGESRKAQAD